MRQLDHPEQQPALPPPIRKPASEPDAAEKWQPIGSHPGYQRNQRGDVRTVPAP